MKLIAHRGNLVGPFPDLENRPNYLEQAILQGFDVEVDVWYINGELFLGHDEPTHPIYKEFLQRPEVWAHAKNFEALDFMLNNAIHCFWHENDARTLTSQGYVWTYPGKETISKSVIVELGYQLQLENINIYGVCGDYVANWKKTHSSLF